MMPDKAVKVIAYIAARAVWACGIYILVDATNETEAATWSIWGGLMLWYAVFLAARSVALDLVKIWWDE